MSSEKSNTWHSSSYFNELQKEDKTKYNHKFTLTNGQLLPDLYGDVEGWKGIRNSCLVSLVDMYNYLVNQTTRLTTTRKLKKSLEAFNFFICNHVQDIYFNEISKKFEFGSIKTKLQKYLNIFIKKLF